VEIRSDVELGGTDQKFNNLVGRELQRQSGQEPQVVLLMPILVGLDGVQKMSKSLGNYVGINEPPAEMFGKIMSIPDEAMRSYYTLCTEVPLDEVETILAGHPMEAKKRLGSEIVAIYHGVEAGQEARRAFEKQFSNREVPDEMPEFTLDAGSVTALELIKTLFGAGGSEARRMFAQGAVTIEGNKVGDPLASIELHDGLTVKMGKLKWARVRVNS
jgi:tyrosyl-tRNA synthetase